MNDSEIYNTLEKGVWRKLNIRTAGSNTVAYRLSSTEWYCNGITGLIRCNEGHAARLEQAYQDQQCPMDKVEYIKPQQLISNRTKRDV